MKKWIPLLLVCIVFSMGPAFARDLNIVFIPKARDQDFWTFMRQGVERAMQEEGHVNLTWRGPAHNDERSTTRTPASPSTSTAYVGSWPVPG